jgi:hypothetical protein
MKLTPELCSDGISKLALMAFFPGDPDTRAALISVLMQLVETEEQLEWLVERALKLYTRWPGVGELRALYCSRFKPRDGVEAYSEIYQSGFPHQTPAPKALPKRATSYTADPEFEAELERVAQLKQFPSVGRRAK